MKINRKWTKQINLGGVAIGGGAPVSIQSMTKTPTADVKATVKQCAELTQAGCEIIRLAVPDEDAARALSKI
ncbi:MAG: flavodoxin-dependent (E)-4-hydroxy-3-methylbut-2-enyl-diphosphate synthase, partial [bacterium]